MNDNLEFVANTDPVKTYTLKKGFFKGFLSVNERILLKAVGLNCIIVYLFSS